MQLNKKNLYKDNKKTKRLSTKIFKNNNNTHWLQPIDTSPLLQTLTKKPKLPICQTLTQREGLGLFKSFNFCKKLGIHKRTTWNNLSYVQREQVQNNLNVRMIDTNFRQKRLQSIRRLIQAKHIRGLRYCYCLPTRRQRTQTNRYTARRIGRQIMLILQPQTMSTTRKTEKLHKNKKH